jgi:hypothetical protein
MTAFGSSASWTTISATLLVTYPISGPDSHGPPSFFDIAWLFHEARNFPTDFPTPVTPPGRAFQRVRPVARAHAHPRAQLCDPAAPGPAPRLSPGRGSPPQAPSRRCSVGVATVCERYCSIRDSLVEDFAKVGVWNAVEVFAYVTFVRRQSRTESNRDGAGGRPAFSHLSIIRRITECRAAFANRQPWECRFCAPVALHSVRI